MKLHIKNFRSIEQLDLEIAPITVLYGHNGTGKSSALYAPLTMKNIVVNPNQEVSGFFNYGFTSLGEFSEVVFDHNPNNELELGISVESRSSDTVRDIELDYRISFLQDGAGSFQIGISKSERDLKDNLSLDISFPYDAEGEGYESFEDLWFGSVWWNGISFDDVEEEGSEDTLPNGVTEAMLKMPTSELKKVSFVPLGRGFFQPKYTLGQVSTPEATEQDMSSLLATDRHLANRISYRMEQILNRNFQIHNDIGTIIFSLDSFDRQSGVSASLVNEGFGVNQLVYMMAKVIHPDAGIVCIEEPEIHLHPSAIRRLVHALAEIVGESDDKRLIISTHSEQFIMSLLALVAGGSYAPGDLAIYLVSKEGKASEFHRQQVSENGQIEDGLASFLEGELEDMKVFLGV